jgi:hypothetical protein
MDASTGGNNASTIETILETLWAPETRNYVPGRHAIMCQEVPQSWNKT